jgi:hypothetical protein
MAMLTTILFDLRHPFWLDGQEDRDGIARLVFM